MITNTLRSASICLYVVAYQMIGESSAATVARNQSRLDAAHILQPEDGHSHVTATISQKLTRLRPLVPIYDNALFGRTVERVFVLPSGDQFHDVSLMRSVLESRGYTSPSQLRTRGEGPVNDSFYTFAEAEHCLRLLHEYNLFESYHRTHLPTVDVLVGLLVDGWLDDADLEAAEGSLAGRYEVLQKYEKESGGHIV